MANTRRRAAKKAVPVAEPEAPSAAYATLLAAIEASANGGVIYERAAARTDERGPSDALPSPAGPNGSATRAAPATDRRRPYMPPARPRSAAARMPMARPAAGSTSGRSKSLLKALDGLPPIRMPIGPAIPWRYGLPGLVALVVCMALLSRPTAHAQSSTGFKLPAESETYAVTQDSPLFAKSQQQPIGVAEPAGPGVDVLDLSLKLIAVLALAYGSLALLKRLGVKGATRAAGTASGTAAEGLRVLSTLALAPNRSIHVVRTPDGKTLLLGATPGQVNLIAELGELPDVPAGGSSSFLDVLASKLQQH